MKEIEMCERDLFTLRELECENTALLMSYTIPPAKVGFFILQFLLDLFCRLEKPNLDVVVTTLEQSFSRKVQQFVLASPK